MKPYNIIGYLGKPETSQVARNEKGETYASC